MRWEDFPLPDGSYSDATRPWTQQDVVNYLPTLAELPGSRSRVKLEPVPGLKPYAVVGDGPHRGARDVEGRAFVVSGNKLYRVSSAGIAIPIGTIPGTGLVSMTHNQIAGGNQLVIGTRDNSYVYDTVTDTLTATGVGLSSVDFLGQMILGVSTDRRFWRHSALADAKTYSELDVYSAESAPDRIVGGIASQSEWLAFGERTIETFANSPTENAAFQRMAGAVVEKGCANGNTIRRLDNSVFWLGDDLIVYRMQGYQPIPISTKAMAAAFRECDPAKAFAFTYEDHGYVIYYLTFQDGQTWGYDATNQRWHRRESFGLDRWRLNTLFKSNGEWYGGDYSNGNLYKLEWGYMFEGQAVMRRRVRTGVMHANENRVFVHALKVVMDSGLSASVATEFPEQPAGPSITGAAPDGLTGEAYSFAYTVTPGDAPISRTVLRGVTLPTGWSWNEATATISAADPSVTFISLSMRVYDTNGLYADHTDDISITQKALLLVAGVAIGGGDPVLAYANAREPLSFVGIAQSTGADLSSCIVENYDGVWLGVSGNQARYCVSSGFDVWQSSAIPFASGYNAITLAGGPAGWVTSARGTSFVGGVAIEPAIPSAFETYGPNVLMDGSPGSPSAMTAVQALAFDGSDYLFNAISGSSGNVCATNTLGDPIDQRWKVTDNFVLRPFNDATRFDGKLYACSKKGAAVGRQQLVYSVTGGRTWEAPVLDFVGNVDTQYHPYQLAAGVVDGVEILVVLCWGAEYVWTSADNFAAPHATGIATTRATNIEDEYRGKQIAFAAGRFYIVSGTHDSPAKSNKCVSTADGLTFSAPVGIPLQQVRSITAGAVA